MDTLGVYIQVPFCASKCSFCNFSSQVAPANVFDAYCRAIEQEIDSLLAFYKARDMGQDVVDFPVDTVYVGGGTPSLLGAERLEQILSALRRRFELADSVEFTLEVTPGSANHSFLERARGLGVNRLSIGAQSFEDRELRSVGRLHSPAETLDLVRQARGVGFANVSLDLIAGLPYQNETSWSRSLREVVQLKPEHISVYLFEIDEKSRLGGEVLRHGSRYHAPTVPDDNFTASAYESAREILSSRYIQYEISNFALDGHESRHNQKYWQLKPYVGLGAGAHSFDGRCRWANETTPEVYQEKLGRCASPITEMRTLPFDEQLEEFFFLGLRQRDGVDLAAARDRWGSDRVTRWEPRISVLERDGMLERCDDWIRIPKRAYLVSNEIFEQFLI